MEVEALPVEQMFDVDERGVDAAPHEQFIAGVVSPVPVAAQARLQELVLHQHRTQEFAVGDGRQVGRAFIGRVFNGLAFNGRENLARLDAAIGAAEHPLAPFVGRCIDCREVSDMSQQTDSNIISWHAPVDLRGHRPPGIDVLHPTLVSF